MINIKRWYNDDCTIGRLTIGDFQCFTLELPWKENKRSISCIPEGLYEYTFYDSPKNGYVIQLENVRNRDYIQVHSGNFTYQVEGCILVGDSVKWLNTDKIPDVTNSRDTLNQLLKEAKGFDLIEIRS